MIVFVVELYDALRLAGVEETMARRAAESVFSAKEGSEFVTKADLRAELANFKAEFKAELKAELKAEIRAEFRAELRTELADLRVELIKWNLGAMAVLTTIFATIVTLN